MIRKLLPVLALVAGSALFGCKSSGSESSMVMSNDMCPVSGKAVDKNCYYDYNGTKIYTCCSKCPAKVAQDPEAAMMKAYGHK